jgi:diguanylate cyclase
MSALAQPHTLSGHELWITASIGISVYPGDGTEAEVLLSRADRALYHAKETGRNRYQFSNAAMNRRPLHRRSIEAGLHRAFDRQEFELVYQPRIDLTTQAMVGMEALLRWRHPDGRVVAPASFLAIATECGLMGPIGGWVVGEACRQARAWNDAGFRPIPVSINLSAKEFCHPGLLQRIDTALRTIPLDRGQLEIELTEGIPVADVDTIRTLDGLKTLGVPVILHDLGTGYADLDYIRRCPIDALKIGRSFVQRATIDAKAAAIVSTMIRLGKSLTARVIAEGVETPAQLAFLQAEHCDQAQGYLFSRPLVASTIDDLLGHPGVIQDRWSSKGFQ